MSEAIVLSGIVIFLSLLALALPYVNEDFGLASESHNISETSHNLKSDIDTHFSVWTAIENIFKAIGGILLMFLWTFGGVPWYLDAALLEPIRITGYIMVIRLLRG